MNTYYSTFPSELGEIVKETLEDKVNDFGIKLVLDGLIVYQTNLPIEKIKHLRFFNNSFLLIRLFEELGFQPLEEMIKFVLDNPQFLETIPKDIFKKGESFRVIASRENQLTAINKKILEDIETLISSKTKLILNRSNSNWEFWFLARREGYGFFSLRLTKHPNYEKVLDKGELRPELAYILCLISEPKAEDVFLDPFSGSGAIPFQRLAMPYQRIVACDNNQDVIRILKEKVQKRLAKIEVSYCNALNLKEIKNESVNKIVTDPPWGLFLGKDLNLNQFYESMIREFDRILKKDGLIIILVAKKELFEKILKKFTNRLTLLKKYDILVSGQKAAIYKILKTA